MAAGQPTFATSLSEIDPSSCAECPPRETTSADLVATVALAVGNGDRWENRAYIDGERKRPEVALRTNPIWRARKGSLNREGELGR